MSDTTPTSDSTIEHVYIHVPFCLRKCGYCSFYSQPITEAARVLFLDGLHREIEMYHAAYDVRPRTIYFGGGTPSLLSPDEIDAILARFDLSLADEITIEANPATVNDRYAAALAATPVNRVSLGAQSFDDAELQWLGRMHNADATMETFAALRRHGQRNLSLDIIYGLPGQTQAALDRSLDAVQRLAPEHVSLYCLSLEPGTPLWSERDSLPADDAVADLYEHLCERLPRMGYEAYELSSFAKVGFASRHNLSYWDGSLYIGLGPSAAGNLPGVRYRNPAGIEPWLRTVQAGNVAPNAIPVSVPERRNEFMFLGLRRTRGVSAAEFAQRFGVSVESVWGEAIERYERLGMLRREGERLMLTPRAWFVSNEILQAFC
ncbi:MAG: radical SAM family heme chaperone HemW [Candidatus Cloacimonetes bacterium]|nr:radical SAM family heme chaperone HemW [Candidatus Cloacimonadota bacterium]